MVFESYFGDCGCFVEPLNKLAKGVFDDSRKPAPFSLVVLSRSGIWPNPNLLPAWNGLKTTASLSVVGRAGTGACIDTDLEKPISGARTTAPHSSSSKKSDFASFCF